MQDKGSAKKDPNRPAEKRFRTLRVPMPRDTFYRLPPNAAYKYEYIDGEAQITPQPHCCDLFLDLDSFCPPERLEYERWTVRPLEDEEWARLPTLAAAAFFRVAPFATFGEDQINEVMAEELAVTHRGGDGQLITDACMLAQEPWGEDKHLEPVGAALVTLRQGETNDRARVPLLTWIFVSPWFKRHGISGGLLGGVVSVLKKAGYHRLESVVCTGNHASAMWHWRMGFQMGPSLREKLRRRK